MCLIVAAFQVIRDCPVFLAANRDEIRTRPWAPPEIVCEKNGSEWLGGRDLVAGGTWLGVNSHGLLIAVTNRNDRPVPDEPYSRGLLCRQLLQCDSVKQAAKECERLLRTKSFAGFNLLAMSRDSAVVLEAGREESHHQLSPGLYILTNTGLNVGSDHRGQLARTEFAAMLEPSPRGESGRRPGEGRDGDLSTLISNASRLCGQPSAYPTQLGLCLTGERHGTVSTTIIALTDDANLAEYRFSDDPQNENSFKSHSNQLRELLNAKRETASHRIHLKGPWDYEWMGPASTLIGQPTGRVTMPADWKMLFGDVAGRATFRRRFNCPTNLTPDDRVFLQFDAVGGNGTVSLNGEPAGEITTSCTSKRLDITTSLQRFNDLLVTLEFDSRRHGKPGGLFAPVALVIESPTA